MFSLSSRTAFALKESGPAADVSVARPSFSSYPWASNISFSWFATSALSWLTVLKS